MADRRGKLLEDMLGAGRAIGRFVAARSLDDFRADLMLRSAVERQFEIIGEALRRLQSVDPPFAARITRAREIVAFRNLLAHGYDVVDQAIVWGIIGDDLPTLISEVLALRAELDRTAGPGSTVADD